MTAFENWKSDQVSKQIIEKEFSYEIALSAITI